MAIPLEPTQRNRQDAQQSNPHEIALAEEASRVLADVANKPGDVHLQVLGASEEAPIVTIPESAFHLFLQLLSELSRGHGVTVMAHPAELTTQQAADLLNVSRPYLIKRLEAGDIPFRLTGTHRRVRFDDLMTYKHRVDEKRREALDELAALSQDLNLDDLVE